MRVGVTKPMILQDARARRQEKEIQENNGEIQSTTKGMNPGISTGAVYHL